MTPGRADRLKRLAEDLLCAGCRTRPRIAGRQVCRECRRQAEEREMAARSRLIPNPGRSNHQQAAASATATRKVRRAARAAEPAPRPLPPARAKFQPRQLPEALNAKSWAARLADWAKRCWGANDPTVRERIGVRDIGGDIIEQTGGHIDFVYGGAHGVPQMRVIARSDPDLDLMKSAAERMWKMPREGAVVTANGYSDTRVLCLECGARVKAPCDSNPSRAASCPNRSRGNR
jgi:hypothetical protein